MNEEMDEIRRRAGEMQRLKEKMAYENMVNRGHIWVKEKGVEKLEQEIQNMRIELLAWNKVSHASIPLTLSTIDTMLQTLSMIPFVIGMQVLQNPQYAEHCSKMSAIRNKLIEERDAKLKGFDTGLSTPPSSTSVI